MKLEEHKKRDLYKESRAVKNGFSVIRIRETDVLKENYSWRKTLLSAINELVGKKVKVIFWIVDLKCFSVLNYYDMKF